MIEKLLQFNIKEKDLYTQNKNESELQYKARLINKLTLTIKSSLQNE